MPIVVEAGNAVRLESFSSYHPTQAQDPYRLPCTLRRVVEVSAAFEYADVEGDSKIVIGVPATRVRYDLSLLGSPLCVEVVLFVGTYEGH